MADDLDLIDLYQEMAELTLPKCKQCPVPFECCASEYCELAIREAKKQWNVTLEKTDHPTLPLMGKDGCVAAPHLRPICTVHVCSINSVGCDANDSEWTEKYFKLRSKIEVRTFTRIERIKRERHDH